MKASSIHSYLLVIICFCAGCANIMTPSGGKKDTTPPKLVSAAPPDSMLNTKVKKLTLHFDEYIVISDVTKEVQISPILSMPPLVTSKNKEVTVKLTDSLLEENTTYRISFGKAIRDLHENNIFPSYTYTFSTGSYFDSLELNGKVINAVTGLPDTGSVFVVLYGALKSDSAVVREKPKYISTVNSDGTFLFKGLPAKKFRIYAIKDNNGNLIYDGGNEMVGFISGLVTPGDTSSPQINLRIFKEIDTLTKKDTVLPKSDRSLTSRKSDAKSVLSYSLNIDTSNASKRTFDITKPIEITFNKPLGSLAENKITLTFDSAGKDIAVPVMLKIDTVKKNVLILNSVWHEEKLYTLRLLKGFVKDTSAADAMPSKYIFRTKNDDDYGKLNIHLPAKYFGKKFLFMVNSETDTVHYKPVTDTMVYLNRLRPGKYTLRIIIDENGNLKWDTGDLLNHVQPEYVVPYDNVITVKAAWENTIDFVPPVIPPAPKPLKPGAKPGKIKPK